MTRYESPRERADRELAERYAASVPFPADHHPLCKNHVEPVHPPHVDGQESLL